MSLTHFDAQGRAAMVDVSAKDETARVATARGRIVMAPATLALLQERWWVESVQDCRGRE